MNESEKTAFLKTAYLSLRPGRKLAILSLHEILEIVLCTQLVEDVDMESGQLNIMSQFNHGLKFFWLL